MGVGAAVSDGAGALLSLPLTGSVVRVLASFLGLVGDSGTSPNDFRTLPSCRVICHGSLHHKTEVSNL